MTTTVAINSSISNTGRIADHRRLHHRHRRRHRRRRLHFRHRRRLRHRHRHRLRLRLRHHQHRPAKTSSNRIVSRMVKSHRRSPKAVSKWKRRPEQVCHLHVNTRWHKMN